MLKRYLLPVIMLLCMIPLIAGCSDNMNDEVHPADSSGLFLTVTGADGKPLSNNTLRINSNSTECPIMVNTTSRWTVEITDCDGAWCQIVYPQGETDHSRQGEFIVDVTSNRASVERTCKVTVYCVDVDGNRVPGYSYSFTLFQERQYIIVDARVFPVSASGTSEQTEAFFSVTANQDWTASTTADWLSIVPGEGMTGDGFEALSTEQVTCHFRVRAATNLSAVERTAEVIISSPNGAFIPDRKIIRQEGSTDTFIVVPTGSLPVSPGEGETVEIRLYSPNEPWRVTTVGGEGWLTVSPSSGDATPVPISLTVRVDANSSYHPRTATIVVSHGNDTGGAEISLTQAGGGTLGQYDPTPVVSQAYVISGWTDTWAQIRSYWLSPWPETQITGGGLFIRPADGSGETRDVTGYLDRETRQVITDVSGLTPGTEYEAWNYVSYVIDGRTAVSTGGAITFTTTLPTIPHPDENIPPNP